MNVEDSDHVKKVQGVIKRKVLGGDPLRYSTVARAGKFFSDADTAGISWDVVKSASLPEGVEELRARFAALELPALERAINVADMMVVTPPACLADTYLVKPPSA